MYPTQSHYTDTRPTSYVNGSHLILSAKHAATTTILRAFGMIGWGLNLQPPTLKMDTLPTRREGGNWGLMPYQHLWSYHSENKVVIYSVLDDQIYQLIEGKPATRITTLLF